MKKINLLFVLFFVFIVKSNAQQLDDTRFEKKNTESVKLASPQMSDAKINTNAVEIKSNKELKESLSQETPFVVKNNNELKTAEPTKRKAIEGNRAEITNQPLKRYNEDLVPVKVK